MAKLLFRFPNADLMKQLGADPRALYSSETKFNLEETFKSFKPKMRYSKAKLIPAERQLDDFTALLDNGITGNPIIAISSIPTDARAKILALNLMSTVLERRAESIRSSPTHVRKAPRWYTLYNQYLNFDNLKRDNPCCVFISNIPVSTGQKLERLRDLMEFFADVPRILVTAGPDPVGYVADNLYLPVNYAFCVGSHQSYVPNLIDIAG